ncbi:MAG: type VI secretion system membrane subunit TssM [Planctomycetes bacterium]|nr:type VI secretion system membrane subunit TssM [Planctomycetota bacterium]MCW8135161.1 type VI secretion system membrane subunit TssM [Planctomycetota bacterium]
MRPFLTALMKEGVFSIAILVLLLVLIWGVAFYTRGENADWMNLPMLITMAVIGLWVVLFIGQKVAAVRSAVRIEKQLKAQSGAQLQGASADKKSEVQALRAKFEESLNALKKTKGGKSALFTLPWYVIIGPPGSGKTTALQESGLNFPAVQGGAKVRGIGGTRNCDWWFTEDGILLDTAGRYTTVAEDQEEWLSFLDMIRHSRKTKPINGAIVAISMDDLFRSTQSELDQIAKDVRNRLDELSARLQAVFPVYLMFTKCDLIRGFVEFFEDFNKDERAQVWGFTMAYRLPDKQYTALFDEQCDRMLANIRARQLELLASERPAAKKQNIYLFPRQFQLAREKMKDFLGQLFGTSAVESSILRGVYFTSGTQKGTPIDQLMQRLGAAMGMDAPPEGFDERLEKKSFFINHLFTRVMFPDKTLARSNSRVIRKRMAWRYGVQLLTAALFAAVTFGAVGAFNDNRVAVNAVAESSAAVKELPGSNTEKQFIESLKALDAMRTQLEGARAGSRGWQWGMDQRGKVFDAGATAWHKAMSPLLAKPCHARIEAELKKRLETIRASRSEQDYQSMLDLWRVYGMIGCEIEPKPDLINTVLKRNQRFSGPVSADNAGQVEALAGEQLEFYAQLIALAWADPERYAFKTPVDPELYRRCREELREGFWIPNAYSAIIRYASDKARAVPGDQRETAAQVTERVMLELAPGLRGLLAPAIPAGDASDLASLDAYTQTAWNNHVEPAMKERASDLAKLLKELGRDDTEQKILDELYRMHALRQAKVWDDFINVLQPAPGAFVSVETARSALATLGSESNTPLRNLVQGAWGRRALNMSANQRVPGPTEAEGKSLDDGLKVVNGYYGAYDTFANNTKTGRVRYYTGEDAAPVRTLASATTTASSEIARTLATAQKPAGELLQRVIIAGYIGLKADAATEVKAIWDEQVVKFWEKNFARRYPFDTASANNAPLAQFSEFFNPAKGRFWAFDKQLRAIADLSFSGNVLVESTAEYLEMRRFAASIRDAMFHEATDERVKINIRLQLFSPGDLLGKTRIYVGRDKDNKDQFIDLLSTSRNFKDFTLTHYEGAGIWTGGRVEFYYGGPRGQELTLGDNLIENEWGFFRILHDKSQSFALTDQTTRKEYFITWKYRAPAPTNADFELHAKLTAAKGDNPFAKGFFTSIKLATGVIK